MMGTIGKSHGGVENTVLGKDLTVEKRPLQWRQLVYLPTVLFTFSSRAKLAESLKRGLDGDWPITAADIRKKKRQQPKHH